MSKEAMQQALEWFQWFHKGNTIESPKSSIQVKKALEEALAERQGEAVPCPDCTAAHKVLDADPSKIIRNAAEGYPEGRADKTLTLAERVAALCRYAADWQRWCELAQQQKPPLTESEIMEEFDKEPEQFGLFAFEAGVRYAERVHGIGGEK